MKIQSFSSYFKANVGRFFGTPGRVMDTSTELCNKENEGGGYLFFEKLGDVKKGSVAEKLAVAAQNG